jgi:hypothetical protein
MACVSGCGIPALKLRKWDPTTIRDHSVIVFIGHRRTGKTWCLKEVLGTMTDKASVVDVFSDTMCSDESWPEGTRVHPQPGEVLNDVDEFARASNTPEAVLVMEDLDHLHDIFKNQEVRNALFNARWKKISVLMTVQCIMELNTLMRTCADYVVCMMEPIVARRKLIYQYFAGMFRTFEEFDAVFKQATANYGALVIDTRCPSYNIEDAIFWFRAK